LHAQRDHRLLVREQGYLGDEDVQIGVKSRPVARRCNIQIALRGLNCLLLLRDLFLEQTLRG